MDLIKGTYKDDCIFLLKDLTGIIKEITIDEKEELIKKGISYSEMISVEENPSLTIEKIFFRMIQKHAEEIASYVGILAEKIYKQKKNDLVIASLARAGTPYGILIRKYLKFKYDINIQHYSISIIRGKGIDYNALLYILEKNTNANIQFVDGWTGKGSIIKELKQSIDIFNKKYNTNIDDNLAVIADPAKLCRIYGTRKDIAVPNSVLNSTVSGLISRTILNDKYIGENEFHGAINIEYLKDEDYSQLYVDSIAEFFNKNIDIDNITFEEIELEYSNNLVKKIKSEFDVNSINNIKLSIGEASRVLLRRKARILLLKDKTDLAVQQLIVLANEKNIQIREYKNMEYKAIAIIEEGN